MAKVRRLGVFSFATFQALIMAIVGLIAGILYSFGGLVIDGLVSIGWVAAESVSTPGLSWGTVLAFGALIGMPVIFSACGFLAGLVEAVLFNQIAGRFGGIEIGFEQ